MTLAIGLVLAATVIGVLGPWYLAAMVRPAVRPGLALVAWASSAVLFVGAMLVASLLLALPKGSGLDGFIGMAGSCVNIVRQDGDVVWAHVVRLGVAAVLFSLVVRVAVVAVGAVRRQRRWRRDHVSLLGALARPDRGVFWLDAPLPVAYSVGGRRGWVVATSAVDGLGPRRRAAILSHEEAHLRGRHHLLVLGAEVLASALPFVPLCRRAPAAVRVLAELAADVGAARRHGTGAVRSALLAVRDADVSAPGGPPPAALAMSRDAVDLRLQWLARSARPCGAGPGWSRVSTVAVVLMSAVPAAFATASAAVLLLLWCLTRV